MSLPLYLDQHVDVAIARGLRRRGINVLRTQDDGTSECDDVDLLLRASSLARVVYTEDKDFLRIAREFQNQQRAFAGVVFGHARSLSIGKAIADLELIAKAMDSVEIAGRVIHIPM